MTHRAETHAKYHGRQLSRWFWADVTIQRSTVCLAGLRLKLWHHWCLIPLSCLASSPNALQLTAVRTVRLRLAEMHSLRFHFGMQLKRTGWVAAGPSVRWEVKFELDHARNRGWESILRSRCKGHCRHKSSWALFHLPPHRNYDANKFQSSWRLKRIFAKAKENMTLI